MFVPSRVNSGDLALYLRGMKKRSLVAHLEDRIPLDMPKTGAMKTESEQQDESD